MGFLFLPADWQGGPRVCHVSVSEWGLVMCAGACMAMMASSGPFFQLTCTKRWADRRVLTRFPTTTPRSECAPLWYGQVHRLTLLTPHPTAEGGREGDEGWKITCRTVQIGHAVHTHKYTHVRVHTHTRLLYQQGTVGIQPSGGPLFLVILKTQEFS